MLQLDGSERFGGEWGTLTLDEFAEWVGDRRGDESGDDERSAAAAVSTSTPTPSSSAADGDERRVPFPSHPSPSSSSPSSSSSSSTIYLDPRFEAEELRDEKGKARGRYAVDLCPKLLHCDGSTVDALLAAGAGSYAEFKLVGAQLVWVREEEEEEEEEVEETEREEGRK